ncbi:MAG: serine/threonine-protein kinase [Bryobacteraceae bacterium]
MQQIGRYQILGELGRGAMGIVYKAQDPTIGRTIAIKSIRLKDLTDDAERDRLRDRLIREAQSAGILSHPGIVTIYDVAEEAGMAYIFMEFVNGPPLEKLLVRDRTPDKTTLLSILHQTAAALDYAHRKGIVHRDVKPANIMIHEDGVAKVTDFGVAKIVSQQMTQSGTMMGTPSYMSPEQVQGSEITGRVDQFSLAVIAYEVLTGEKPFAAEYLPTLLYKIVREDPIPPQRLNSTLGKQIESVLRKALAKNPADRYDNCSAFVNALANACNEIQGWMPLPRGASQNLPTSSGSDALPAPAFTDTAGETLADTGGYVSAAPLAPPKPAVPPAIPSPAPKLELLIDPQAGRPRLPPPKSHAIRNTLLATAGFAVLCVALFVAAQKLGQRSAEQSLASQAPVSAAPTPAPVPAPAVVEPPPPVETPEPPKDTPKEEEPARPYVTPPASVEDATFQLTTTPPGAEAVFDRNPARKCTSPCTVTLSAGRHTFVVRHGGYREAQRIIEIPRDSGEIVDLVKTSGTLTVVTNPPGLTVVIDGQAQAQKTPATIPLPVGQHHVQVFKGNDKQEFNVDIADGLLSSKFIEWSQ